MTDHARQFLQCIAQMNNFESEEAFHEVNDLIKRGDVIGINGNPGACPAAKTSCSARSTQLQCVYA